MLPSLLVLFGSAMIILPVYGCLRANYTSFSKDSIYQIKRQLLFFSFLICMSLDRFAFSAPARTKVLVVPVGAIGAGAFSRRFDLLRQCNDIRLLDVAPLPSCHFNPQSFPQGRVLYQFCTQPDDETAFLHDFEPFRKTLLVVGLGTETGPEDAAKELKTLAENHPTAIVHNCIFFGLLLSEDPLAPAQHFYVSPEAERSVTGVETVMCAITRNYLQALDAYAASFATITLRSPVSLTDGHVLTRSITYAQKRLSSGLGTLAFLVFAAPPVADSKLRLLQKQSGRQAKLMGNFFLLAGRCADALQYFTDAAVNCKKTEDYLWLASALEGLAVAALLLLFLGMPYHVQNPMLLAVLNVPKSRLAPPQQSRLSSESVARASTTASPRNSVSSASLDLSRLHLPAFLRLLCTKASQYYQLSTLEVEDCVPDLVYVESLIRSAKFLVAVHLGGGESLQALLDYLVKSVPVKRLPIPDLALVLRHDIIHELDKLFSLQLVDLEFTEQCRVYCALASIYADLGLHRKQAFVLRILLVLLLPKLSHMEQNGAIAGITSVAAISNILELLFLVYKINCEPELSAVLAKENASNWVSLQLQLLKICLRIAEALKDFHMLAKLCILVFARYSHCLPAQEQVKMRDKLKWLTLLFNEDPESVPLPHPDPFLVRDATFVSTLACSALQPFVDKGGSSVQNGPVIFNPYNKTKPSPTTEPVICVNDLHQMKVSLQNPFKFTVELSDIELVADKATETLKHLVKPVSTSQVNIRPELRNGSVNPKVSMVSMDQFLGHLNSVILPPTSTTQVLVSFKALQAGVLTVKGFNIRVGAAPPQFFQIVEREKFSGFQKTKHNCIKHSEEGVPALDKLLDNLRNGRIEDRVATKKILLNVISAQPSLSVTKNLVTNGWLMLLEGEKKKFTLELRNTSDVTIDYLSFSFWDSYSETITAKLNQTSQYTVEDVYELEWSLIKKKPFCVINKQEIASQYKYIQPGGDVKIDYEVTGKKGMLELKLILEYGNKKTDASTIPDVAKLSYMKSVNVPLEVSVEPSLEIIGFDVLPFFSSSLYGYTSKNGDMSNDIVEKNMKYLLDFFTKAKSNDKDSISSYCLLVLDLKNLWKQKLLAKVTNNDVGFAVNEVLDSMQTIRLLLPVKRIKFDCVDVSKPVPSLRNKQFVKNYSVTEEEEAAIRRNFWIRSKLLENLVGEWATVGKKYQRAGEIDMRCIRLNNVMTNSLVFDSIQIQHAIFLADGSKQEVTKEADSYHLEREQFYVLKTKITNNTLLTMSGVLRHVPFPVDANTKQDLSIDQKILYNGVLQKHIGRGAIKLGESHEVVLPFMILEKGRYEWGCVFDIDGTGDKILGREPVYIVAA